MSIFLSWFRKLKFNIPIKFNENKIIIIPAAILNSLPKKIKTFPKNEAAIPKLIKTKENPNAKIVVTGCSAQIDPNKWLKMEEVSNVIGNLEKTKKEFWEKFSSNQENELITSDIMSVREDKTDFSGLVNQNSRYFLQIQNGCDHRCTFCVIPYGRGNSRSVSINKILDNVNAVSYTHLTLPTTPYV